MYMFYWLILDFRFSDYQSGAGVIIFLLSNPFALHCCSEFKIVFLRFVFKPYLYYFYYPEFYFPSYYSLQPDHDRGDRSWALLKFQNLTDHLTYCLYTDLKHAKS